ncbi:MAG: peptide ABC transporter substrate-binding protein [Candidatus Eremiobacteraeota bacterium]|nr:peptide ABC transporter substrate-binding protein [Candidatus Eremiobacteraeota bacterium]
MRSLAAVLAALIIAGCSKTGGPENTGAHTWSRPGVFRFAEAGEPRNLVPEFGSSSYSGDLSMFIFSYAVRYDQSSNPVPDAVTEVPTVENGDVSKDGLTLKYRLRRNIKWHDGAQLDCNDLKFTWQVIMNPHNNVNTTDGFKDVRSIDCSDRFVAVVHMQRLYAPYLQQLWGVNGNAPILPRHLLGSLNDDKGSMNTAPYLGKPVGSGPFSFVSWQRGSQIRLKAYPDFYFGKPKLNEVIYRVMPDENTMETQLQTHEIDMVARGSAINSQRYQSLANDHNNGLILDALPSFIYSHIDFNLRHPIVNDLAVRRALAYATNRPEILNKVLHGFGTLADTDQSPVLSWAYTNDIVKYPYDPARGRALLDADGWKTGPDGVRAKNGQRLEFNLSTQTESTYGHAVQTVLQHEWRDVGVAVDVKNAPTNQFFDNNPATGVLQGGHYDAAIFSWVAAADPDDSPLYTTKNFAPQGQNNLFWSNPKVDAAAAAALGTLDRNKRKAYYKIVQQQMALDVPTIIMYFWKDIYLYNNDLKGFTPSPVISAFWNPWEYSI